VVGGLVILRKETAGVTITAKAGGGSDTRTIKINPVPVASIELTPTSLNLDAGGSVVPLTATVLPANATNKSVTWNSSNTTVATVSNGVVTSVAPGTATITARSISNTTVTKTCAVTVKAAGPVSLPAINTYVYIPGGTVASGYAWGVSKTRTVGSFAISRTEVHYELWYKVKEWGIGNGYTFQNPGQAGSTGGTGAAVTDTNKDQPVTTVSWRDAVVWCNAYSEMTGEGAVYRNNSNAILKDSTNKGDGLNVENLVDKNKVALYNGYRLPTEEEWEYAARGGVPSSGVPWTYTYAGSNTVDDVAWLSGNSGFKTHSVGWKPPNSAGLYDMSGNVWEFCFAASGAELVDRGGNFGSAGGECAVAYSPNCVPDYVSPGQGFRLVCR
jgi:formylglycine-generating enzyme required for sulfatase activity